MQTLKKIFNLGHDEDPAKTVVMEIGRMTWYVYTAIEDYVIVANLKWAIYFSFLKWAILGSVCMSGHVTYLGHIHLGVHLVVYDS